MAFSGKSKRVKCAWEPARRVTRNNRARKAASEELQAKRCTRKIRVESCKRKRTRGRLTQTPAVARSPPRPPTGANATASSRKLAAPTRSGTATRGTAHHGASDIVEHADSRVARASASQAKRGASPTACRPNRPTPVVLKTSTSWLIVIVATDCTLGGTLSQIGTSQANTPHFAAPVA